MERRRGQVEACGGENEEEESLALTSSMKTGSCWGSMVSTWISSLNCTDFFSIFTEGTKTKRTDSSG